MITVTVAQVVNPKFQAAFQRLTSSVRLPLKTAWALRSLDKTLRGALEQYEQLRKELCLEYSQKNPETGEPLIINGAYQLVPETITVFNDKFTELLNQRIDLPHRPLGVGDLGDDLQFTLEELESLIGIVLSDEDSPK